MRASDLLGQVTTPDGLNRACRIQSVVDWQIGRLPSGVYCNGTCCLLGGGGDAQVTSCDLRKLDAKEGNQRWNERQHVLYIDPA